MNVVERAIASPIEIVPGIDQFTVVWFATDRGGGGPPDGVFARRFTNDGRPLSGDVFLLADRDVSVRALPDGGFALSWATDRIMAQIYNGALLPQTFPFVVDNGPPHPTPANIVIYPDGNLGFLYGPCCGGPEIERLMRQNGTTVAGPFQIPTFGGRAAVLADSSLVIAERTGNASQQVSITRVTEFGLPLGGTSIFTPAGSVEATDIAASPSGGFTVVWTLFVYDPPTGNTLGSVLAQRFRPTPRDPNFVESSGPQLQVNTTPATDGTAPYSSTVTGLIGDGFAALWLGPSYADTLRIFSGSPEAHLARVQGAYLQGLNRFADENGSRYWTDLLDQGVPLDAVALLLAYSAEGRGRAIDLEYETTLGRTPDGSGRAWTDQLIADGRPDVMKQSSQHPMRPTSGPARPLSAMCKASTTRTSDDPAMTREPTTGPAGSPPSATTALAGSPSPSRFRNQPRGSPASSHLHGPGRLPIRPLHAPPARSLARRRQRIARRPHCPASRSVQSHLSVSRLTALRSVNGTGSG